MSAVSFLEVQGITKRFGGLTANDFITYYLTLLIVDQLTSEITIHILAYKIQDGTLSGDLLRPVHPILTGSLINNIAFKALNLMAFIPIWIVLFLLGEVPELATTPLETGLLLVAEFLTGLSLIVGGSGLLARVDLQGFESSVAHCVLLFAFSFSAPPRARVQRLVFARSHPRAQARRHLGRRRDPRRPRHARRAQRRPAELRRGRAASNQA